MDSLQGKRRVALVTGGMGGLGEAICLKLAALGYAVVTTQSPTNTHADKWLREMRERGCQFHAFPCDVSDWDSCVRSEEHTSELQSRIRISYAVFCLKKKR